MDIVVCGAQKPFMRGGAEQLQEALVGALQAAGHQAELVRLPVGWEKGRLLDAPLAWRLVPVDADLVIATNFPSYFIRHPHKVVWLLHQHRGAYDAADAGWSDFGPDPDAWETQRILTEWDNRALAEAQRLFTLSEVVSERLRRYNGLAGEPLPHPPPLVGRLRTGPAQDYLLFVSRLEANKRPGLALRALAASGSGLRLVVAGTGSLRAELETLAADLGVADRVEFVGFVSDEELLTLFAGMLALIFAPLEEDYGYVSLQALGSAKPVITSSDAGGVLDFVADRETGLVTDGSPEQLGRAIDVVAADRDQAARWGQAGRNRVAGLDWPAVVARLVDG